MSAKKSKTFFKTLTAILVLLLFFGGYYICIFLLFYHSPVGFSTSNNCRVSKQKLFCQFIIPS